MLKRILSICILGATGLLVIAFISPVKTERIAINILSEISNLKEGSIAFLGNHESAIKIVDPAVVPDVVKKDVSVLASFFKSKPEENSDLPIEDVIDATNRERIAAGLPPLKINAKLTASAKLKTEDMIALQYFEHTSPSGVTVSDLGKKVGYNYIILGENLALGNFTGAQDLLDAWMASPGHKANIINPLYQEVGIYAAKGMYQEREVWFAVQHFGTSRGVCPSINLTNKQTIDIMNTDLERRQKELDVLKEQIEDSNAGEGKLYQDMVDRFNQLVAEYNQLLSVSQQQITQYNKEVSQFNSCLIKYQK